MRRALGKGLSQLIAEQYDAPAGQLPVDSLVANARQPRTHFDDAALEELANSIRQYGVLQPLVVRPLTEGQYEVIAGERRLRAARLAGLEAVPVVIRGAGEQTTLELALIENLQREDISAMECARAYRRLMDEFGLTQEQVAQRVGKSRVAVANTVRLLRLPKRLQDAVEQGLLSEGHARALLPLEDEARQLALLDRILAENMSVRDVERLVKRLVEAKPETKKPEPTPTKPTQQDLELREALSTFLGTPVRLERGESGGRLVVDFYSEEDLTRILDVLGFRL